MIIKWPTRDAVTPVVKPAPFRTEVRASRQSVNRSSYQTEPAKASVERLLGTPVEAISIAAAKVLHQPGYHALMAAANCAFSEHYPLVLTPDMLWVTIIQGLASHVNAEPETWRKEFVKHDGQLVIRILLSPGKAPWGDAIPQFSAAIKNHIGDDTHALIINDFSTTGALERAAAEIGLMDVCKSYFDYRARTMCGIPHVVLEGTKDDWQQLAAKVNQLAERFPALEWWLKSVRPVLDQIIKVFTGGRPDEQFWESVYKLKSQSGGARINGWLLKFIPFVTEGDNKSKWVKNPCLDESKGRDFAGIYHMALPQSVSVVPFTWENSGQDLKYQFIGGMMAVEQDRDTMEVRASMGWAVRPAPAI